MIRTAFEALVFASLMATLFAGSVVLDAVMK